MLAGRSLMVPRCRRYGVFDCSTRVLTRLYASWYCALAWPCFDTSSNTAVVRSSWRVSIRSPE